jgi:hypothetical protein
VGALQPDLPTLAVIPRNAYRIIKDLEVFFFFFNTVPGFCFSDLVIVKSPLSNIIGKFCLKEWLIALHYVKKCVCTSIQVRTLNISVYTIHYMDILLAYPSDGVLLPLLFL